MQLQFKPFFVEQKARFEALNNREKGLIGLALISLLYGLYVMLIEPVKEKADKTSATIQANVATKHSLELQLNALTQKKRNKEQTPEQLKVAQLKSNIDLLATKIDALKASLISPAKVPDLLKDLLAENQNLQLVALSTLPPEGLFKQDETNAAHPHAMPVFKHGVEMKVKGHYLDLMQYIEKLESMPWHILWESAKIVVEEKPKTAYPLSELTLTVYSMSLDKQWLSI